MLAVEARGAALHVRGRALVERFDVAVEAGTYLAVFGGIGAGKTTALRMLAGRSAPTAGEVRILGRSPRGAARFVAFAAQDARHAGIGTVHQALVYQAGRGRATPAQRSAHVAEALAACDLYAVRDRHIRDLSRRERELLEVALAIARRPAVLFLDDLMTAMPPGVTNALWSHLDERRGEDGLAVIHATTSLSDAERADTVLLLDAGRALACEPPSHLLARVTADTLTVEAADPRAVRRTLRGVFDVEIAETGDGLRFRAADGELATASLLRHPAGGVRAVYLRKPTLWDALEALRAAERERAPHGVP
jgi:ABC-type multidrug transport system ATPase subunit